MPVHRHNCACGNVLFCGVNDDQCAVTESYQCPTCVQAQIDDYFRAEELKRQPIRSPLARVLFDTFTKGA